MTDDAAVALFEKSLAYASASLDRVDDDDLGRPTPCPEWDLRRLVLHLADSADALAGLIMTGELSFRDPPRTDDPAPATVARERMERLHEVIAAPGNPDLRTAAAQAGAIEFATHGWDVTRARGDDRPVPEELATALVDLTAELLTDDARGANFAAPTTVPTTAPAGDRLIAFLGRTPR